MSILYEKIAGFAEWIEESGGKPIIYLVIIILIEHVFIILLKCLGTYIINLHIIL